MRTPNFVETNVTLKDGTEIEARINFTYYPSAPDVNYMPNIPKEIY